MAVAAPDDVEFVVLGVVMVTTVLAWWRYVRRPDDSVPTPIADRGDFDVHQVNDGHVYSTTSLRVRAPSSQGVRMARGSIPPPTRAVSGEFVVAITEPVREPTSTPRVILRAASRATSQA